MKDLILQVVKQFLNRHYQEGAPLLLGCSGGPDSLALLHLLLECNQFFSVNLHVAHIDHNWREESAQEAEALSHHVKKLEVPFYLHTLEKGTCNTEEGARLARFHFFSTLYQELHCQALVLGHQADDQAETVLKRILEGASLGAMGGIRPIADYEGMSLWRPLLTVSKKSLNSWIVKRGLQPVEDPTNQDPQYLRSRMRVQIIPDLEDSFGKAVSSNLVRFGDLAHEVKSYVQRTSRLFQIEKRREGGEVAIDFNPYYPLDSFELKIFLKHFLAEEGVNVSFRTIDVIQKLIEKRTNYRVVDSIIINNGRLLLVKNK